MTKGLCQAPVQRKSGGLLQVPISLRLELVEFEPLPARHLGAPTASKLLRMP